MPITILHSHVHRCSYCLKANVRKDNRWFVPRELHGDKIPVCRTCYKKAMRSGLSHSEYALKRLAVAETAAMLWAEYLAEQAEFDPELKEKLLDREHLHRVRPRLGRYLS